MDVQQWEQFLTTLHYWLIPFTQPDAPKNFHPRFISDQIQWQYATIRSS